MRQKIQESIEIPAGIHCEFTDKTLTCKKDSLQLQREIKIPSVEFKLENNTIIFTCKKGNKIQYKIIKTYMSHIKNMFRGLQKPFRYKLEVVNVHFPMTLKVEGDQLVISNFLGEKTPRRAKILKDVKVEIKGQEVLVTSPDLELAGQTAANIEKSAYPKSRDRRVFQDGIYITERPGDK